MRPQTHQSSCWIEMSSNRLHRGRGLPKTVVEPLHLRTSSGRRRDVSGIHPVDIVEMLQGSSLHDTFDYTLAPRGLSYFWQNIERVLLDGRAHNDTAYHPDRSTRLDSDQCRYPRTPQVVSRFALMFLTAEQRCSLFFRVVRVLKRVRQLGYLKKGGVILGSITWISPLYVSPQRYVDRVSAS